MPEVNSEILYSFVPNPGTLDVTFLGFANLAEKSFLLALLAGITQHFQARFAFPKEDESEKKKKKDRTLQDDIQRSMGVQIKYVLPVIITVVAYTFVSVVSLYWVVSNLFSIGQEIYIRNTIRKPAEKEDKEKEKKDNKEDEEEVLEAERVK